MQIISPPPLSRATSRELDWLDLAFPVSHSEYAVSLTLEARSLHLSHPTVDISISAPQYIQDDPQIRGAVNLLHDTFHEHVLIPAHRQACQRSRVAVDLRTHQSPPLSSSSIPSPPLTRSDSHERLDEFSDLELSPEDIELLDATEAIYLHELATRSPPQNMNVTQSPSPHQAVIDSSPQGMNIVQSPSSHHAVIDSPPNSPPTRSHRFRAVVDDEGDGYPNNAELLQVDEEIPLQDDEEISIIPPPYTPSTPNYDPGYHITAATTLGPFPSFSVIPVVNHSHHGTGGLCYQYITNICHCDNHDHTSS